MMRWLPSDESVRYRLSVASRVLAATVGGYLLTSAATVLLALAWPLPKAQALHASVMLSFTLYLLIIIWAFSVRRVSQVWLWLTAATLLSSALVWWLLPAGAGA